MWGKGSGIKGLGQKMSRIPLSPRFPMVPRRVGCASPPWHSQESLGHKGPCSGLQAPILKCVGGLDKELRGGHRKAIPGAGGGGKVPSSVSFRFLHFRGQLGWMPGEHTEQGSVSS